MEYFGITLEGNVVFLGTFDNAEKAENYAADYAAREVEPCDECGHASTDVVYWGSREHFNAMFDKLAK